MNKDHLKGVLQSLPHQPGCYKYYDAEGNLLYVGKAKNLKKRVNSYFTKQTGNYKTARLVQLIDQIEYTVTETEHDAFLLENALIKRFQPKYNIDLKDDKSFPFIVLKKEPFPRVFLTRRVIQDGSEYLGPFTSVARVREMLELIRNNIPLRTCNLNLAPARIAKGTYKVCLQYHLGNCKGPCEGLQTEAEYHHNLMQVRHILKGNLNEVMGFMKAEMTMYAERMEYEKAAVVKSKMEALQRYQSKSTIVNKKLPNLDIITMLPYEDSYVLNYMMFAEGSIAMVHTVQITTHIDEDTKDILGDALAEWREQFQSDAKEIVAKQTVELWDEGLTLTLPKAGNKKQLLDLSEKNVQAFIDDLKRKSALHLNTATQQDEALLEVQEDLQLPELPSHIECFDNSNFQGAYPVAAMVCFKNGRPDKKNYRHYNIKTVEGINDFASMSEVVYRRYKRLLEEQISLPQLIIIDGGKGQLNAAMESINELGLTGQMTVVGLAKREESIFFPGDKEPLQLPYSSASLKLIRSIRDEVHRFGITFHRKKRSQGTFKNELESIKGIGKQTATELLQHYKSVAKIKTLTERELTGTIGASKAKLVYRHFHEPYPSSE